MSVAFEIEVTRSRSVARRLALVVLVPAAGLALAAFQIAAGPTLLLQGSVPVRAAAALATAIAAILLVREAWRALRHQSGACPDTASLSVDATGEPRISTTAGAPAVPAVLRASCRLPGLILLVLSPYAPHSEGRSRGAAVTLLSGRDALSDDDWRRLNAWLRWMERGRHTLPSS